LCLVYFWQRICSHPRHCKLIIKYVKTYTLLSSSGKFRYWSHELTCPPSLTLPCQKDQVRSLYQARLECEEVGASINGIR
jgi:hypothetical protein